MVGALDSLESVLGGERGNVEGQVVVRSVVSSKYILFCSYVLRASAWTVRSRSGGGPHAAGAPADYRLHIAQKYILYLRTIVQSRYETYSASSRTSRRVE